MLTAALDELEPKLGPGAVLRPDRTPLEAYEQPARGTGGHAVGVVRPASTEEVRVVIRWAVRHGVRLLPQGANSGLVGASVPPPAAPTGSGSGTGAGSAARSEQRPLMILSTDRLIEPIEVFPDDRVAIVPAGVHLSTLNDLLAAHDLVLPIDLGADPCLGGMVATNTGGARMLRNGDVRRRVIGLQAVLADVEPGGSDRPTVLDDLTRLRKDNTGPSATSFLIGSAGAFGVVTRVAVELERRPPETACAFLAPISAAAAMDALRVLEGSLATLLSAYEVISATALDMTVATVDGVRSPWSTLATPSAVPSPVPSPAQQPQPPVTVLVEAAGPVGTGDALERAVSAVTASGALIDAVLVPFDDAWHLRHSITEGLARNGSVIGFDVSVPRSELVEFRDDVTERTAAALPRAVVADFGHWADGGTHCNLVFPDRPPSARERRTATEIVFGTAVQDHHGSYSAEHGIGPHNAEWWRAVTPAADKAILDTLKDRCDPHRILGHPALPF